MFRGMTLQQNYWSAMGLYTRQPSSTNDTNGVTRHIYMKLDATGAPYYLWCESFWKFTYQVYGPESTGSFLFAGESGAPSLYPEEITSGWSLPLSRGLEQNEITMNCSGACGDAPFVQDAEYPPVLSDDFETANYKCDAGFTLVDSSTNVCVRNAWTGAYAWANRTGCCLEATPVPKPVNLAVYHGVESGELIVAFGAQDNATGAVARSWPPCFRFTVVATRTDSPSSPAVNITGYSSPITIGGLLNDVQYQLVLIAHARLGEEGAQPSRPAHGVPLRPRAQYGLAPRGASVKDLALLPVSKVGGDLWVQLPASAYAEATVVSELLASSAAGELLLLQPPSQPAGQGGCCAVTVAFGSGGTQLFVRGNPIFVRAWNHSSRHSGTMAGFSGMACDSSITDQSGAFVALAAAGNISIAAVTGFDQRAIACSGEHDEGLLAVWTRVRTTLAPTPSPTPAAITMHPTPAPTPIQPGIRIVASQASGLVAHVGKPFVLESVACPAHCDCSDPMASAPLHTCMQVTSPLEVSWTQQIGRLVDARDAGSQTPVWASVYGSQTPVPLVPTLTTGGTAQTRHGSTLEIAAFSHVLHLAMCSSIRFTATVTQQSGPLTASASVSTEVAVQPTQPVARISGGNRRVGRAQAFTVSAADSSDPDSPTDNSGLVFKWNCYICADPKCVISDEETVQCKDSSLGESWPRPGSKIALEPLGFTGLYKFRVRVSKTSACEAVTGALSSFVDVLVTVTLDDVPLAQMSGPATEGATVYSHFLTKHLVVLNPSQPVVFEGAALLGFTSTLSTMRKLAFDGWVCNSSSSTAVDLLNTSSGIIPSVCEHLDLGVRTRNEKMSPEHDFLVHSDSLMFESISPLTRVYELNLAFKPGVLLSGKDYIFQLLAQEWPATTTAAGVVGLAEVTVRINIPPVPPATGEVLQVRPQSGVPMSTAFAIGAPQGLGGWSTASDNLPIKFAFGIVREYGQGAEFMRSHGGSCMLPFPRELVLSEFSAISSLGNDGSLFLWLPEPPANISSSAALALSVYARSSLGATTRSVAAAVELHPSAGEGALAASQALQELAVSSWLTDVGASAQPGNSTDGAITCTDTVTARRILRGATVVASSLGLDGASTKRFSNIVGNSTNSSAIAQVDVLRLRARVLDVSNKAIISTASNAGLKSRLSVQTGQLLQLLTREPSAHKLTELSAVPLGLVAALREGDVTAEAASVALVCDAMADVLSNVTTALGVLLENNSLLPPPSAQEFAPVLTSAIITMGQVLRAQGFANIQAEQVAQIAQVIDGLSGRGVSTVQVAALNAAHRSRVALSSAAKTFSMYLDTLLESSMRPRADNDAFMAYEPEQKPLQFGDSSWDSTPSTSADSLYYYCYLQRARLARRRLAALPGTPFNTHSYTQATARSMSAEDQAVSNALEPTLRDFGFGEAADGGYGINGGKYGSDKRGQGRGFAVEIPVDTPGTGLASGNPEHTDIVTGTNADALDAKSKAKSALATVRSVAGVTGVVGSGGIVIVFPPNLLDSGAQVINTDSRAWMAANAWSYPLHPLCDLATDPLRTRTAQVGSTVDDPTYAPKLCSDSIGIGHTLQHYSACVAVRVSAHVCRTANGAAYGNCFSEEVPSERATAGVPLLAVSTTPTLLYLPLRERHRARGLAAQRKSIPDVRQALCSKWDPSLGSGGAYSPGRIFQTGAVAMTPTGGHTILICATVHVNQSKTHFTVLQASPLYDKWGLSPEVGGVHTGGWLSINSTEGVSSSMLVGFNLGKIQFMRVVNRFESTVPMLLISVLCGVAGFVMLILHRLDELRNRQEIRMTSRQHFVEYGELKASDWRHAFKETGGLRPRYAIALTFDDPFVSPFKAPLHTRACVRRAERGFTLLCLLLGQMAMVALLFRHNALPTAPVHTDEYYLKFEVSGGTAVLRGMVAGVAQIPYWLLLTMTQVYGAELHSVTHHKCPYLANDVQLTKRELTERRNCEHRALFQKTQFTFGRYAVRLSTNLLRLIFCAGPLITTIQFASHFPDEEANMWLLSVFVCWIFSAVVLSPILLLHIMCFNLSHYTKKQRRLRGLLSRSFIDAYLDGWSKIRAHTIPQNLFDHSDTVSAAPDEAGSSIEQVLREAALARKVVAKLKRMVKNKQLARKHSGGLLGRVKSSAGMIFRPGSAPFNLLDEGEGQDDHGRGGAEDKTVPLCTVYPLGYQDLKVPQEVTIHMSDAHFLLLDSSKLDAGEAASTVLKYAWADVAGWRAGRQSSDKAKMDLLFLQVLIRTDAGASEWRTEKEIAFECNDAFWLERYVDSKASVLGKINKFDSTPRVKSDTALSIKPGRFLLRFDAVL
jgi:hypothetical protein